MKKDESPETTAARELIEETGYSAGELKLVHEFYSAPGICDELMHLYVARDLTKGAHQREATEEIENRIATRAESHPVDRAKAKFVTPKTLVGLYAFLYSPIVNE